MTRATADIGDSLAVSTVAGLTPKSFPLAPFPNNYSYETVSDQPEAQPNQPVSVPISFHGGLAYDHYDERTGGCLVNTGILTNEPNVLRAPVKVNTVTLTDAIKPPQHFFEAEGPSATIAHDASSSDTAATKKTITVSHTVGSDNNRILIVGVSTTLDAEESFSDTCTFGGTSLTRLAAKDNGTAAFCSLWYLVNPSSGTADVVFTSLVTTDIVMGVSSYEEVDLLNPFGSVARANGTSDAPSVAITSASGELVVDVLAAVNPSSCTVGADQTERWNTNVASSILGAGSSEPGAASVTMSWALGSSVAWSILGVPLRQAAGPLLYIIAPEPNELKVYKVSTADSNFGTLLNTKAFSVATTQPMGRPAEWNDGTNTYWRVPQGDNGVIESLTAVASGTSNDTWSGGDDADARHLLVVKNQLYRTTGANEVSVLARATDPETEANWGDEFYVGDPSHEITDMAQVAGICLIPKSDGAWEFDGVAEAANVLPEIGIAERNGQGLSYGRGGFFVPGIASLYWTRTGEPIGPDSYDDRHAANDPSITAGEYFKHGRWMGTANYNGHFYGLYVNSVGTSALVVWGYPVGNEWRFYALASVTADFDDFHGVYVSETSKFSASEIRPCLWFANGNDLSYIWLDKNGAPMLRRGDIDVAAAATVTSGRIDFGFPRVPKQLRFIDGWAEDMEAGASDHSFTLNVYRDGSTVEAVGSVVNADGYFDEYWTQDTNDTCRSLLFSAVFAGGTDTTDINGPLLRDIQLHAVLQPKVTRVWQYLVYAKDDSMKTSKTICSEWEAYIGDLLKFKVPFEDAIIGVASPLEMLRADEISKLTPRSQTPPSYVFRATVREMPSS